MGLSSLIPIGSDVYARLLTVWSQLTPRPGTHEALGRLATRYRIAPLSNADTGSILPLSLTVRAL